jgi:hypothetical protein
MNSTSTKLIVQSLTRKEFLELLGLTGGAFDQLQHAGHVALAFGTPLPATKGRYLDLDLVAMAINLGLSASRGREISTTIVASFFHQWARAVGHAEANRDQNFFMAVGGAGWDASKKSPELLVVTHGTVEQIAEDFRDVRDLVGFININVSDIIRRFRARAQAVGIDLDRPFFLPPDDPRFDQILTQYKRERDARIARLRRTKKKFPAGNVRARRHDFSEPPRVMNTNYEIALRIE